MRCKQSRTAFRSRHSRLFCSRDEREWLASCLEKTCSRALASFISSPTRNLSSSASPNARLQSASHAIENLAVCHLAPNGWILVKSTNLEAHAAVGCGAFTKLGDPVIRGAESQLVHSCEQVGQQPGLSQILASSFQIISVLCKSRWADLRV